MSNRAKATHERIATLESREALREAERQVRRSQLLEAAIEAIRVIGPGATMEQLAKSAGVTKPILYRHFGNRDGLITALASRYSLGVLESVQAPLQTLTSLRAMLDMVDGYVRYVEQDPHLYGFLRHQSTSHDDAGSAISSLVDVIAKQIAASARDQLAAAELDTGAALPWAYGIVGMVHQATDWWLADGTMGREQFVGHLTDLLWNGLVGASRPADADARA